MDWTISESNQLSSQDIDRQGGKFLIGNGYIGYRGTLEEFNKDQKTATIVSGLYDQCDDQWREPVNLPNGGFFQVIYNGEPLHVLTSDVVDHTQSIDMRNAIHERRTKFQAADGTQISICSRRFVSLARRHLICMEFSVRPNRECEIEIHTGIDGDVWDLNGPHLQKMETHKEAGVISLSATTGESAVPVAVSEAISSSTRNQIVPDEDRQIEDETHTIMRHFRASGEITVYKFVSHITSLDTPDPLETSRDICQEAVALGYETLLQEHIKQWQQRWMDCDIQIEGDPTAQQALRFSMYQLLSIVPTHTHRASIPARGMSGQMYKGAVFWDTEIFMLPFFIHAFPALARNLLLYRYHTLDGARRKARDYGYRGAFYAWESQDTGDDACSLFNITDVFTNRPIRTYFRDKQIHISADIPYAFWKYYIATGDDTIWRDGGAEVIFECARFFLSHIYYNPDKERYEFLDVTGPDEYHERVHNNVFTNRVIAHAFSVCLRLAELLRTSSPAFFSDLLDSLDFERDLTLIAEISPHIFLPDNGLVDGLIPQFDGYFKLENVPLKTLLERRLHPNEYFGGGNGLATTTQVIKQADVVLTLFLFDDIYSLEKKSVNWEYYEPRTEHVSSLSACSYSLVAAQIGKIDRAYKYFMKTATIDLTGESRDYLGTLYIGGTHPASSGGAWMSAVFGLCGIRWDGEILHIDPRLPDHWKRVVFPFVVRGQKLKIEASREYVFVKPVNRIENPLSVSCGETTYALHHTDELAIPVVSSSSGDAPKETTAR